MNQFHDPIYSALLSDDDQAAISAINGVLTVSSDEALPSWFDVSGLASAAVGAAGVALARVLGDERPVRVDQRLASLWFGWSIRPDGWAMPAPWDSLAGDYQAKDGWIKLHTNVPHHRDAAVHVLGGVADREDVARAVDKWAARDLETAIVDAGGCAAEMRSMAAWRDHPQGSAVRREPLIAWATRQGIAGDVDAKKVRRKRNTDRPLADIRVLDLTRVLAGPVGTRFLAAFGAEVLRIDPPDWREPGVVPEVTLGKRCAGLNLRVNEDREIFERLLSRADILLHGYRPGALDGLGYGLEARATLNPDLIDVSLCAYGWSGPWSLSGAERRGFDSLVQMSSGIAHYGMTQSGSDNPTPLPVQALDHATGYLMAAAALEGVIRRDATGTASTAQLSLAKTAHLLVGSAKETLLDDFASESATDIASSIEVTDWGPARRIRFPVEIEGITAQFDRPATDLRTARPDWLS